MKLTKSPQKIRSPKPQDYLSDDSPKVQSKRLNEVMLQISQQKPIP